MAKKFNLSITIPVADGFSETLQVEGCDSMDEAYRILEKAVKDRLLEIDVRVKPSKPIGGSAKEAAKLGETIRVEVDKNQIPGAEQPGAQVPDLIQGFKEPGDNTPAVEVKVK